MLPGPCCIVGPSRPGYAERRGDLADSAPASTTPVESAISSWARATPRGTPPLSYRDVHTRAGPPDAIACRRLTRPHFPCPPGGRPQARGAWPFPGSNSTSQQQQRAPEPNGSGARSDQRGSVTHLSSSSSSGLSTTRVSVVSSRAAMEAALARAERVTLTGSMTPSAMRSTY